MIGRPGFGGAAFELDMNVPDALIIEAVTDDGGSVTIEIPFSDSGKARVTVR